MSKKILIPGGTGAMGVYLVPELLRLGYKVDVVSLEDAISNNCNIRYIKANAKNYDFISELLKNEYDVVVDFMIYPTKEEYEKFFSVYLKNTGHYIFLSTYRVYANEEHPIKETSPRILDIAKDAELLSSGDYCIYKAQAEDYLNHSEFSNWSIIRPAITYSKSRFQLVTMEYELVIRRMLEGKALLLPEKAMDIQATMSWAGDVAKMIASLVLNEAAFKETFSVCTSEHHTWGEIAEMYKRIGGLKFITVDTDTYLQVLSLGNPHSERQLKLDRYFDRVMDNSKILNIAGMKQSELMPLEKGLSMEFSAFPKNITWKHHAGYDRMDEFLKNMRG